MRNHRPGFTFVELLVAMLVVGALTGIAVPRYRSFRERAYLAGLRSDLGQFRIAEEAHWAEFQRYSTQLEDLDWRPTSDVSFTLTATDPATGLLARARHAKVPGMECEVAVGHTTAGVAAGEITCGTASTAVGTGVTTP